MRSEGVGQPVRFNTGGRTSGIMGLVGVAGLLLYGVLGDNAGFPAWLYPVGLFAGVAIWVVLVRPAVVLDAETVELRNMLHTRWIPLARITEVSVRQVTFVVADGERYVGTGVGRTRRQMARDKGRKPDAKPLDHSYGWVVEERLRSRAREARDLLRGEPPAIRHAWAWPEIAALGVLALVAVVLVVA